MYCAAGSLSHSALARDRIRHYLLFCRIILVNGRWPLTFRKESTLFTTIPRSYASYECARLFRVTSTVRDRVEEVCSFFVCQKWRLGAGVWFILKLEGRHAFHVVTNEAALLLTLFYLSLYRCFVTQRIVLSQGWEGFTFCGHICQLTWICLYFMKCPRERHVSKIRALCTTLWSSLFWVFMQRVIVTDISG